MQAVEPGWITSNQIEAARVAMTRYIRRVEGLIKIFPKPVTANPLKQEWVAVKFPEYWVAVINPAELCLKSEFQKVASS